jgi:hypothetical protein
MSKGASDSDKALVVAHASLRQKVRDTGLKVCETPVLQVQQEEAIQANEVCPQGLVFDSIEVRT